MNPLPLLAIGAVVLLASGSSKDSSKNSSSKSPDKPIRNPAVNSGKIGGLSSGGKTKEDCSSLEYYDEKKATCVPFWVEGETDEIVKKEIQNEVNKFEDKSFASICEDQAAKTDLDVPTPNKNAQKVIVNVINKLWGVPKNRLPPVEGSNTKKIKASPAWLWTIWNRVGAIYYKEVCGM